MEPVSHRRRPSAGGAAAGGQRQVARKLREHIGAEAFDDTVKAIREVRTTLSD